METTAAIAGVRGTEFGIDATDINNPKLIVLSGSVAARKKTDNEKNDSAGTDVALEYDSADPAVFGTAELVTNNTGDFQQFTLAPQGTAPSPDSAASFTDYEKYYTQTYSNSLEPRINEIDVAKDILSFRPLDNGKDPHDLLPLNKILAYEKDTDLLLGDPWEYGQLTINPVTGAITINTTSANLFFTQIAKDKTVLFVFEDEQENRTAFSHPPILIQDKTYLTWEILFGGEVASSQSGQCSGSLESITLEGKDIVKANFTTGYPYKAIGHYQNNTCTQEITSDCDWKVTPSTSATIVNPNIMVTLPSQDGQDHSLTITCAPSGGPFGTMTVMAYSEVKSKCIGDNLENEYAQGDDKGYWVDSERACWVLADENNPVQSCTYACTAQLSATCEDLPVIPPNTNWDDDDKDICLALAKAPNPPISPLPIEPTPSQQTDAIFEYSPFFKYLNGIYSRCYARGTGIEPSDLCGQIPSSSNEHRICRCI